MNESIRAMRPDDYDAVAALWRRCPGVGLSDSDDPVGIHRFLARNPGLSSVAVDGDQLIGAVLCGEDGRRGYIHHLAVDPQQRRRGLGRALVERSLARLAVAGIAKCHIFIFGENREARAFWRRTGWSTRPELEVLSMPVSLPSGGSDRVFT